MVRTIAKLGGFLDLATTGEVQLITRLGLDTSRCIHTHPIKRDKDIRNALAAGVRVFVADNPDEVRKFRAFRGEAELLLRVSFRAPGAVSDLSRKFGCDPERRARAGTAGREAGHHGARILLPTWARRRRCR